MGILVQHDRAADTLHLIFLRDRLVTNSNWIAQNADIDLAADGEPVQINVYEYYSAKSWPLTEALVEQYGLQKHLDDLRLVWENFFSPPGYAVKSIKVEGPDGNELIIPVGADPEEVREVYKGHLPKPAL